MKNSQKKIEAHWKSGEPRLLKSRRANASRDELRQAMSDCCSACSAKHDLEFDCHPVPETSHHFMPQPERIRFYWLQFRAGNLRLLCKQCHLRHTALVNSKAHAGFNSLSASARAGGRLILQAQLAQRSRIYAALAVLSEFLFDGGDGI